MYFPESWGALLTDPTNTKSGAKIRNVFCVFTLGRFCHKSNTTFSSTFVITGLNLTPQKSLLMKTVL